MSTETLTKLNPKILINSKFDPNGSDANVSDPKTLNAELNKVELSNNKKSKHKTCINKLNNRLKIQEKNKKIEAKKCSTGEQKSLLMGIILSHLELVSSFKSRYPVLLLDEVLAHFDKIRRKSFFKQIQEIGSQIIMTGTDISVFEELGDLEIYHLSNKKVTDIR